MGKKLLKNLFIFLSIVISIASFPISFVFANKVNSIIYINNSTDFYKIADNLNGHYLITSPDAIIIDKPWVPIGTKDKPFTGILDGLGQSVYIQKGFSDDYICEFGDSESIDLGLFGYNRGIIKHLEVFGSNSLNNELVGKIERMKTIINVNYGIISGTNDGYITTCRANCSQISLGKTNLSFSIGGISGINNKQIQGCTFFGRFNIKSYSKTNIGMITGLMNKESIIKYCYKSGDFYCSFDSHNNNNIGLCVGLCKGGLLSNVCFSDVNVRFTPLSGVETFRMGAIIGTVEAEGSVSLDSIYSCISFEGYLDVVDFAFLTKNIFLNSYSFNCSNTCFKCNVKNLRAVSETNVYIPFCIKESDCSLYTFFNNHVLDVEVTGSITVYNFNEILFSDSSTSLLGLDDAIWRKGDTTYFMDYEKKYW